MIAAGIDLGGTKIEAQVFDEHWAIAAKRRISTPYDYDALITQMTALVHWAEQKAGHSLPIGLGAAGLMNPANGLSVAANLPTNGHHFLADITAAIGRPITHINDSQALALSEAVFGAGRTYSRVLTIALGTGVSGGYVVDRQVQTGPTHTGGEFGHIAAPAHLVQMYNLPLVQCGCGQIGCIETLISGGGLTCIAQRILKTSIEPEAIIADRATNPDAQKVWDIWCALTGDLIKTITRTLDPDCIVLGGGLSQIDGIAQDIATAAQKAQFNAFGIPPILIAQGGTTSGARGAAYAARTVLDG